MSHPNRPLSSFYDRMVLDMTLAGFTEGTQRSYLGAVRQVELHFGQLADQLTEQQLQEYALYLRNEKKVARGTFQNYWSGLRFLYAITLDCEWSLFTKKKWPTRDRSVCRWPRPISNVAT